MKRDDLVPGEIYIWKMDDYSNDYEIFRATENLDNCPSLEVWDNDFGNTSFKRNIDVFIIPTKEQRDWFEYCESLSEYRPLEEALDYMMVKEFVDLYLTEE